MRDSDGHTLAGAYALDALPEAESRFFEAHLAICAACKEEVVGLQATAARLGGAAAQPAPPELRRRVFAEIDATRQEHLSSPRRGSNDHAGVAREPRPWRRPP